MPCVDQEAKGTGHLRLIPREGSLDPSTHPSFRHLPCHSNCTPGHVDRIERPIQRDPSWEAGLLGRPESRLGKPVFLLCGASVTSQPPALPTCPSWPPAAQKRGLGSPKTASDDAGSCLLRREPQEPILTICSPPHCHGIQEQRFMEASVDQASTQTLHGVLPSAPPGLSPIYRWKEKSKVGFGATQPRRSVVVGAVVQLLTVGSHSWRPHGLQHARLPSPSPTPRACSNSCPSR